MKFNFNKLRLATFLIFYLNLSELYILNAQKVKKQKHLHGNSFRFNYLSFVILLIFTGKINYNPLYSL